MAPVVYEGVAGGGDLFQGQKFFIVQRVPRRNDLIGDVERNGGFVVPLEKNADVLIADHAKPRLAPNNAVSWTYLEQSMKKGQLEDLETHRIVSSSETGLPGGPSQPRKLTRTPFTREESMAISIWVAKAELKGLSVRGNEIYVQFAAKNPRHTAQSWRDHWVKQHAHQARPDIDMSSTDWPVDKEGRLRRAVPPAPQSKNATTTANASEARKRTVVSSPSVPAHSYPPEDKITVTEVAPLANEVPFTEGDYQIIEKEYSDIIDIPPATLVYAWEAFAQKYGRHTAGDWCNFYYNHFMPRKCQENEDKDARAVNPKPSRGQTSTSKTSINPVREAASSRPRSESRDTSRSRKVYDEAITSKVPESEISEDQSQIGASADKEKFLGNLSELSNAIGSEIGPYFSLYGRSFELYDLWSVVNKPEFGGFCKVEEANKWMQVAVKLNINTYRNPKAHTALKQVYCDKLVDLDTHISPRDNGRTGVHTSPQKSTEPTTPVTYISTQTAEQAHAHSSVRRVAFGNGPQRDGNAKGLASPTKSMEPVTPVTVIPKQTPEQARSHSSGLSTSKTLRPAKVVTQESAYKDAAAERIRQSLGHGELAFLQSLSEFAQKFLSCPVTFEPIVSKRKIRLFNVWAASLPLLDGFDDIKDTEVWNDLATKLGFDISADPSAPEELKQICNESLADFYQFFHWREQEKLKEEALRQQYEDQGQSEEESVDGSDDNLEYPSLAFRAVGSGRQKRPRDQDNVSPSVESRPTSSHSHDKRPKISKGKERADEIPSTPEHIYNNHLSNNGKLPDRPNAKIEKLIETNIEYFPPPSPLEELDSSPSRQLWSEAIEYTPPSQNNNDEEETQSQTESESNEIQEFINGFVAKGFEAETVQQMLTITTMEVDLAVRLLSDYAKGLEIPKDIPGVWTEEDDNGVKSHVRSGDYKRALKKHGEVRCSRRKEFLKDYENAEEA